MHVSIHELILHELWLLQQVAVQGLCVMEHRITFCLCSVGATLSLKRSGSKVMSIQIWTCFGVNELETLAHYG